MVTLMSGAQYTNILGAGAQGKDQPVNHTYRKEVDHTLMLP